MMFFHVAIMAEKITLRSLRQQDGPCAIGQIPYGKGEGFVASVVEAQGRIVGPIAAPLTGTAFGIDQIDLAHNSARLLMLVNLVFGIGRGILTDAGAEVGLLALKPSTTRLAVALGWPHALSPQAVPVALLGSAATHDILRQDSSL
jgi:hypothetical protein